MRSYIVGGWARTRDQPRARYFAAIFTSVWLNGRGRQATIRLKRGKNRPQHLTLPPSSWFSPGLLAVVFLLSACDGLPPVRELQTPAGRTLLFQSMPSTSSVVVLMDWPNLWAKKEGYNTAVPRVASQLMLVGGAGDNDALELQERYIELGVSGSLRPKLDKIYGVLRLRPDKLLQSARLLNLNLRQPSFDSRWAERVAAEQSDWRRELNMKSKVIAGQTLINLTVVDPLARENILVEDLQQYASVDYEQIQQWHKMTFAVAAKNIVVVGNLDAISAVSLVDRILSGLPTASAGPETAALYSPLQLDFDAQRVVLAPNRGGNTVLLLGGEVPAAEDADLEAIIAVKILGDGEHGRLFRAVRDNVGGSYGFNANIAKFTPSARYLELSGEVSADKLQASLAAVRASYAEFWRNGPSEREVQLVRDRIEKLYRHGLRNLPMAAAAALREHSRLGWGAQGPQRVSRALAKLDAAAIKAYVQSSWPEVDEFLSIAVADNAEAIADACLIDRPAQARECRW